MIGGIMTSEEQTKADLLTLVQGRNQRIAELELLVLDLNRKLQEVTNAGDNEKKNGQGYEEKASRQEKKDEKAS